ncbi:MAG: hypothetical protein A3J18_00080 [Candidatus Levybacteria bacterium RIFCSPLOWO2_02_FULL_40_18]|nr:MAG: hypothetical protein A2695_02735 [Candidatus Levybacteria bacterium RIFCSPHIGHO2_01_FULL_40_83]OGH25638.1 MAG: hypothetical protein A3D82_02165 [Candidatus Levybacteria bacterium RIFCSPHIGHO2_02_FULL_40_29]OGH32739.1 MAG: hypothetical protein A3E70_02325 [Candidatus Levybacteria bacterium RIFCSPHIGHO2_12_FULL_40_44]OGH41412.1 MAG: hypothetical protein A2965_02480 [Candidatus Levybacteria bacterium RIFCSPLOWO2_01_FULL_40_96]OGH50548.1 MAG: hypothetical protein A3J18_00080 [Candidatus Lev
MNYANFLPQLPPALLFAILLWSTFWKLLALWRSVKSDQQYWFIAIFLLNTVGILEIVYLFRFAKKRLTLGDIRNGNFFPR